MKGNNTNTTQFVQSSKATRKEAGLCGKVKEKEIIDVNMLGIKTDEKTGKRFVITGPEIHTYNEDGSISVSFPIEYL